MRVADIFRYRVVILAREFNPTRCMRVVDISLTVQLNKGVLSAGMQQVCVG